MATSHWRSDRRLIDVLTEEPYRFRLMQAVTVLQRSGATELRFRAPLDEGFPSADIEALEELGSGRWQIETQAISLYGPNGPLPAPWSEKVHLAARAGDTAPRAFLDIFGNRMMDLLVQIMRLETASAHPTGPETTPQAGVMRALLTFLAHQAKMTEVPRALLQSTGLLAQRPLPLMTAQRVLANHFAIPVEIEAFQGTWIDLHAGEQTRLSAMGKGSRLGETSTLGKRIWVQQAAFRIRLGPLDRSLFDSLQPGGSAHRAFSSMVRFLLPAEADILLTLVLMPEDVPATRLKADGSARLGFAAWLLTKPAEEPKSVSLRMPSQYNVMTPTSHREE